MGQELCKEAVMSHFLSDKVQLLGIKQGEKNAKQFAFQWTSVSNYLLPLTDLESFLNNNFKHPTKASWKKAQCDRRVKNEDKDKLGNKLHIKENGKKTVSFQFKEKDPEHKYGTRNVFISIRNVAQFTFYGSHENDNKNVYGFVIRVPPLDQIDIINNEHWPLRRHNNKEKRKDNEEKKEDELYDCGTYTHYILLVYGYIHEIENEQNNIIPEELIKQCLTFYFDPIVSNMVFDEYGIDTTRMEIINDNQVKCLKGYKSAYRSEGCYGSSIRMKCGLPISIGENNKYNTVSWEITHTANYSFPNASYFIGVVSNRNKIFSNNACRTLTDAYGISGNSKFIYKDGKQVWDIKYKSYPRNSIVKVTYKINKSKLLFTYGINIKLYQITLPTNNNEITYWYPCISLRDKNDICKILNVTVITK